MSSPYRLSGAAFERLTPPEQKQHLWREIVKRDGDLAVFKTREAQLIALGAGNDLAFLREKIAQTEHEREGLLEQLNATGERA